MEEFTASVVPSDLIKEYLSSSNAKNVSLVPAVGVVEESSCPLVILTVKVFLIVNVASVKSTSEIEVLGKWVYNVLSREPARSVVNKVKSDAWKPLVWTPAEFATGNLPLAIPGTVVTPAIVILLLPTTVTLPKIGSLLDFVSVYLTKLPTDTAPGNSGFAEVTTLALLLSCPILAAPKTILSDWTTSALNLSPPVSLSFDPKTDFTSDNLYWVIAVIILPLAIPSNNNASFLIKSPVVSYKVTEVLLLTADFMNPVAPLLAPLTKVGTARVTFWFNVREV